eukprot:364933-Chlamydomonas_euryale.AAC.17
MLSGAFQPLEVACWITATKLCAPSAHEPAALDSGLFRRNHPKLQLAVLCVRYQVLLLFAYAFTIHKSQCMTLDKVVADCRAVFAPGAGSTRALGQRLVDVDVFGLIRSWHEASVASTNMFRMILWGAEGEGEGESIYHVQL